MIIRFSLLLVFGAMASFLLAIALSLLTVTHLAEQASQLGAITLLCAFFVLLVSGLSLISKLIFAAFCDYFSARQRKERKLLFYSNKINRLNRLFHFKKVRLRYVSQQQRKRLLKKHDRTSMPS